MTFHKIDNVNNIDDVTEKDYKTRTLTFKARVLSEKELCQLNVIRKSSGLKHILKADNDEVEGQGIIAGYMSVFDNVDSQGDVIKRGAYTKTLKERTPKVLFNHDTSMIIGKVIDAFEDKKGLFATIQLNLETQLGRDTYSNFKFGALDSFSIGAKIIQAEVADDRIVEDNFMHFMFPPLNITELQLLEVSAVALPANDEALVESVKEKALEEYKEYTEILNKEITEATSIEELQECLQALLLEKDNENEKATELLHIDLFGEPESSDSKDDDHSLDSEAANVETHKSEKPDDDHFLEELKNELYGEVK